MPTATRLEMKDEERTRCEIWTRVMGYHRPVSAFNPGKQSEHAERLCYVERANRTQAGDGAAPQGETAGA